MTIRGAWLLSIEADRLPAIDILDSALGALELTEVRTYQSPVDRQLASLSRAAARVAASAMTERSVLPHEWLFSRMPLGARLLQAPDGRQVNVAIADNENLLAIYLDTAAGIGVDIESWRRSADWRGVAARFFARTEQELITRLPDEEGLDFFTMLWTGKEALAKASGTQLARLLDLPLIDPGRFNRRAWLREGLMHGPWAIRWFDMGRDLIAICCDAGTSRPLPVNISGEWIAQQLTQ